MIQSINYSTNQKQRSTVQVEFPVWPTQHGTHQMPRWQTTRSQVRCLKRYVECHNMCQILPSIRQCLSIRLLMLQMMQHPHRHITYVVLFMLLGNIHVHICLIYVLECWRGLVVCMFSVYTRCILFNGKCIICCSRDSPTRPL